MRPEGTFAARRFGSTVHAFVERMTREIAAAASLFPEHAFSELESELPGWQPAVHSHLRLGGLPREQAAALTLKVMDALTRMVRSAEGRWLLWPHADAASESALVAGAEAVGGLLAPSLVRLDRTFLAGAAPLSQGSDMLWIVDLKTSEPSGRSVEEFLQQEQAQYAAQLQRYAKVRLAPFPPDTPAMLALYYPLLDRLVSWPYVAASS